MVDKVKLGRALGYGARHAARTAWKTLDAVTTSPPRATPARSATQRAAQQRAPSRTGGFALVRKLSAVLWLEVAGTMFGFIAFFIGQGAWRLRQTPRDPHCILLTALAALFAYFAITSFLRARRRGRG